MPVYAPDADILASLQRMRFADLLILAGRLPIVVTDVVWDELTSPESGHRATEAQTLLDAIAGQPTQLLPETPEVAAFDALHPVAAESDAGEASIIAYAICHPEVIPVLRDRHAVLRAIEELRGRVVLSMHGFLEAMLLGGHLGVGQIIEIGRAYRQNYPGHPKPLWWSGATHR